MFPFSSADINGLSYPFPNPLDLLNPDSISRFEAYLTAALDASGYQGEVSLISFPFSGGYTFHIVITSSDAPDLALNFQFCGLQYDFVQEDCCQKNPPPPPAGVAAGLLPHNDDLFYEEITYNKLDISRIEIGSDCSLGYMRNDFSYDANHRVTGMLNTFFNPGPIVGRYNTSYKYDAAGNITRLNRYGLIDENAGQYTYGLIDSLVYTYANGDSRLSAIEDFVPDPLAEQKGFEIAGAFGYDGNGNFTSDGDQGLAIVSNLINLPRIVASPVDSLLFEYTFGGEKIRKLQTSPVARERIYLGGAEFVNDTLELYHHAEGRVVWRDTTPAFQYRIADHLGNTVVFFEDRDGDTKIKTEPMTSDPDSLEVLQRNYYYPFGMEMEGPWQAATAPRADYLYNGKELEEDLGLNWYAYGFRYYDPSIGRFTGVDPIGEQFAELSVYNYASNNPISKIDLHGLQGAEGVWITQWLINKYFAAKYRVNGHLNNLNQGATRSNPIVNNAPISQRSKDFLHKAQTNAGAAGIANEVLESVQTVGTAVHPYYATSAGLLNAATQTGEGNYGAAFFALAMVPLDMGTGGGGSTQLFRAVSAAELDDIIASGVLRPGPNSYSTGKLFATSAGDAEEWARKLKELDISTGIDRGSYHIIEVNVPEGVMSKAFQFEADGMRAVNIPAEELGNITDIKY